MSKIKNIIEYGLYLLVFLLPWQTKLILRQSELNRGVWEYGTIALYGIDILLVMLLILFFILLLVKNKKSQSDKTAVTHPVLAAVILGNPPRPVRDCPPLPRRGIATPLKRGFIIILSGLDLFVFISIFFAPDTILAVYHYALFLLGLGLFWLIVKTELDNKKLAIAFFSGLIIQGTLAIWQFLNQGTFADKWLGLAAHLPGDLGDSVVETFGANGVPERWLRAYGSLDHPNVLGGLLAVGLIALIWIVINNKRTDNKKTDKKFIIYHLSFIIILAGFIFTFCRSAALGLFCGVIIFFIFIIAKKNWPALRRLALATAIGLVLLSLIFANYQDLFITRAQVSTRLEIKSFSERKMYQEDSLALIRKNWLWGVGVGNYTKALAVAYPSRPWYYLNPVHNVFLLVWAEIGVFGLAFFIALIIYLFASSWQKNNILNLSILSALVIIMIFDHYLWSLPFGILFFWLATGIIYKNLNKNNIF